MENLFSPLFSSTLPFPIPQYQTFTPPQFSVETCLLMLNKIKREREEGLYDVGGDIFKGLMLEFEKTIEAFVGSYMVLLSVYSFQLGQEKFSCVAATTSI